jgi:hypothetical protein
MPATEDEERRADGWAQQVVDAWGVNVQAGNAALLTDDFKALFDKACQYRDAKSLGDNHRESNMLSERDADEEKSTRHAFLEAYRTFHKKCDQAK